MQHSIVLLIFGSCIFSNVALTKVCKSVSFNNDILKSNKEMVNLCHYDPDEKETKFVFNGIITDEACNPLERVKVFVWQPDPETYPQERPLCSAILESDTNGAFHFQSTVPKRRDALSDEKPGIRLLLVNHGHQFFKNFYFSDEQNKAPEDNVIPVDKDKTQDGVLNFQHTFTLSNGDPVNRQRRDVDLRGDWFGKKWGDNTMSWLKKRSTDELYDWPKRTQAWQEAGVKWLKKRDWDNSALHWLKKRDSALRMWNEPGLTWMKKSDWDNSGDWLKRGWGNDMAWLKKRSSHDSSDLQDALDNLNSYIKDRDYSDVQKRMWGNSGMHWIKKRDVESVDSKVTEKRSVTDDSGVESKIANLVPTDSDMSWVKPTQGKEKKSWGNSGMSWIKREGNDPLDKKAWAHSGMSWIKRDDEQKDKKSWGNSGMSWIKRGDEHKDKKSWGNSGMSWIKRGDEEQKDKKSWGKAGMSWIKRDDEEQKDKKSWGKAGMSWIKRDDEEQKDKKSWGNAGMSWIKRDDQEQKDKKSWGNSGMTWIKRDDEEQKDKKSWGNSGMSWIKRGDEEQKDKKSWGNAGMSWIKRGGESFADNPTAWMKKNWGSGDMRWIKRNFNEPDRRAWGNEMAWIKRSPTKKSWANSGMSWIKRADFPYKKSWTDAGISWIKKRGGAPDKKSWGEAGFSWIKRDTDKSDKSNEGSTVIKNR